jgi:hydrogenase nickel incorporation protein HypA/HybF
VHELGLCASIVDAVERRAGDREVRRVRVRVGQLHHVHPDAFAQSFAVAARGTVAADATPELVVLPVVMVCQSCGATWEGDAPVPGCPSCGGVDLELIGGDELVLESIEYRA